MNKVHIYTNRINYNLLYIYEYKNKETQIYTEYSTKFFTTTVNITSSAGCVSFKNVNM